MSANPKTISPLRQRMIEDMRLRKLSEKTQSGYIRAVGQFATFLRRSLTTATAEDLRRYQLHLADSGVGRPSLNAAVTALRFFCEVTLGRPELAAKTSHVRAERTLPVILSVEEVTRLLDSAPGLKYQAALSVAYGAGLRAGEVVALKVGDIDSERMAIRVEWGLRAPGPLRDAVPDLARAAAGLVARGQGAGQDAARGVAVPGAEPGRSDVDPPAQSRLPQRGGGRRDHQARLAAYLEALFRMPDYAESRRAGR